MDPPIDFVDRVTTALGTTAADLLPAAAPADPLPVLRDQAERMLGELVRAGDAEAFARLNPILSLILEAAVRRG
ncbi:MAG: family transcriptional regulator [Gemmataceae bacterium]|nr:family transcriptional regulator [Gemmataceae bacterium]